MARYSIAAARGLIMEEDTEADEDSVAEGDANDSCHPPFYLST